MSTVSVVIPTRNRPALLKRAIQSALLQTHPPLEVIVVVDGPDLLTLAQLANYPDRRVRCVALEASVGGAEARNIGVRKACGEWIALLDDDDEWLPHKLESQLAAAHKVDARFPIVSSRLFARSAERTDVWPIKAPSRPYSEYLLVRRRIRYGEGLLQTSTLLVKREFLLAVTFRAGLRKHQDWDWILRAAETEGAVLVFVEEPLSIWRLQGSADRISDDGNWRSSLEWIRSVRHLVTRRAYASFLANYVARQAAAARAWRVAPALFAEALFEGHPGPLDVAVLILSWFAPKVLIQSFRHIVMKCDAADGQLVGREI